MSVWTESKKLRLNNIPEAMINITNATARQNYLEEMDRIMTRLEETQSREIKPVLNRQFMNAAKSVASGMMATDYEVDRERVRLIELFKKHYRRVAAVFSKKVFDFIKEQEKGGLVPPEFKAPVDEFTREMETWNATQATRKIKIVNDSAKRSIRKIIAAGMGEGISHKDIAKNIREAGKVTSKWKSLRIARTETHTAGVKSVDSAIKSTRIEMEREWVSARDNRTRTRLRGSRFEHYLDFPMGANKERVAQDGLFVGTGESLHFPGDPGGSAGNTVNCRCVLLYHTVRSTQPVTPYEPPVPEAPAVPSYAPAKDIDELQNKFKENKIGHANFEGKWSKKQQLDIGNQTAEHWNDLRNKFPVLKKIQDDQQNLFDVYFFKGRSIEERSNFVTHGRYDFRNKSIEIASGRSKTHSLKVGVRSGRQYNYNVSSDFFGNFRHEMGHHIRDNSSKFTLETNKKFTKLWKEKRGTKYFEQNVSQYAQTNSNEAFSECFAAYTSPKYKTGMLPKEIESIFEELLGKPVSAVRKVPRKLPVTQGQRLFKSKADADLYDKYFEEYSKEKLTDKKIYNLVHDDLERVFRALYEWKSSTNRFEPVTLKYLAQKIEKKGSKAWLGRLNKFDLEQMEKILNIDKDAKFREQYIRIRALQQAKFKQDKIKKITLYRGTNGDKSGPAFRRRVLDAIEDAKKRGVDWKEELVEIEENSLVGYTRDRLIGRKFSWKGVNAKIEVDAEDILFDVDSPILRASYEGEQEVIILGGKRKLKIKDLSYD